MTTIDLITLASFVVFAGLVLLLGQGMLKLWRDPLRQRLASSDPEMVMDEQQSSVWLDSLAAQLPQSTEGQTSLDEDLRRAGYYGPLSRKSFLAVRNGMLFVALIGTAALAVWIGPERQDLVMRVVLAGLAVAGLCWGFPRIQLKLQGQQRVKRISRSLPLALDMVTMCLSGGLSLQAALAHVSRELYQPYRDLAVELAILRRQADMSSLEQGLQQFAKRIDAPEIVSLAALISHNQQLGTNIVGAVREYTDGLRLRWRQSADERASKTSVKMLFPLVFCLLPAVFIIFWGPAVLELWNFLQNFELPPSPLTASS